MIWRSWVKRIGSWYGPRRAVRPEPGQFQEVRTVECLIALEEGQAPLRIGQRVQVFIGRTDR
jgi:hypothetical protein